MSEPHLVLLISIITMKPSLDLQELSDEMLSRTSNTYHTKVISRELKYAGYSYKKFQKVALQRDEAKRFQYFLALANIVTDPAQLVFADEVGQDGRGARRTYGWGPSCQRAEKIELLDRGKHISILALYSIKGFISFDYVEGGYSAEQFMQSVEFAIIPELNPYPGPNSILVLDNCQIHHTYEAHLRHLVEGRGAKLVFLAPYCPIDNPIEFGFNSFKMYWRKHGQTLSDMELFSKIWFCMERCSENPAEAARACYAKCGYV